MHIPFSLGKAGSRTSRRGVRGLLELASLKQYSFKIGSLTSKKDTQNDVWFSFSVPHTYKKRKPEGQYLMAGKKVSLAPVQGIVYIVCEYMLVSVELLIYEKMNLESKERWQGDPANIRNMI